MNLVTLFRNRTDQTRIRIVAGDVPDGYWFLDGSRLKRLQALTASNHETLELRQNIRKLELKNILNRDTAEPLVGAGIGALLGLRLFGPLGAAGGAIAGNFLLQKKPEVSVGCELKDGRMFLATMHPKMYDQLRPFITSDHS